MLWLLKDFDLLSVLLRASTLSLEAFTLGGLFFLLVVALPAGATAGQLRSTRRVTARFALALAGAQAASAALSVAILMGGSGFSFGSLVTAGFLVAGGVEVAGCLALAFLLERSSYRPSFFALPAALVLAASVAQSHAASRIDQRGILVALTALHHLGAAGWVGAMLFLLLALRVSPTLGNAQSLARRYSAMALVSAPALVLAGAGMSWFYVGSWAGLYGATYGVMVLAKITLTLAMLLLGAGNYQLLRATALPPVSGGSPALAFAEPVGKTRTRPFLLRLRRFSEAEIGFGITAILAAASLTSQPPAVDLQQDRLSFHQIVERMRWAPPRLKSPPFAVLTKPGTIQQAVENAQFGAGGASDANDRAWSEYNHHWAGLIVLAAALLALAARALPPGRLRTAAHNWPLLFLCLAAFIVLRADPENWPLGPRPFWASFASPDVLQHRVYALLIAAFALFEWAVATGRWRSLRAAYVFPLLCAAGGAALLTHSHGLSNVKDEMLAELAHTPIALLGAAAGWGRWLQLRLPGTRAARTAGLVWPVSLALAGLLLLDYRES